MTLVYTDNYRGNPPVHPVAYHAGHIQEGIRIGRILANVFTDIKTAWQAYRTRRTDREAFQHLLGLDDTRLDDIGVTRADVIWANGLPLSQNAAAELEILARQGNSRR